MGLGMRMRLAGRLALQTTDPRRFAQDRSALLRAGRRRYKPTVVRKPDPPSGNDGDPAVAPDGAVGHRALPSGEGCVKTRFLPNEANCFGRFGFWIGLRDKTLEVQEC